VLVIVEASEEASVVRGVGEGFFGLIVVEISVVVFIVEVV